MKKTVLFLALALSVVLAFSGCSKQADASSAVPANTKPESQPASSEQVSSQETQSSEAASSAVAQVSSAPTSRGGSVVQNGPVKTIRTDSEAFNKKFQANPIDKKYLGEMKNAVSNVDMVKVSNKYAAVWQKEIMHAYTALQDALKTDSTTKWKTIEADQKTWESGKDAALQKIVSAAQADGSMAQVDAASGTMDFYRDRAAKLYHSLYDPNKNYSYAFNG